MILSKLRFTSITKETVKSTKNKSYLSINSMHLSIFALTSSDWDRARFTTDSSALIALIILISLPIRLLKNKASFKNIWTRRNLSKTDKKSILIFFVYV